LNLRNTIQIFIKVLWIFLKVLPMKFFNILLNIFIPESMIDLGCGTGTWLSVAKKLGVKSVLGIDGPWIDKNLLKINISEFVESKLPKIPELKKNSH